MTARTANRLSALTLLALLAHSCEPVYAQCANGTVANQLSAYTQAALPAAGTAGRLACVTDGVRGIWHDSGTVWVPPPTINPKDFGAKGDAKSAACSIGNGSQTLTCPLSATFTAFTTADVGKPIIVEDVGPDQLASDGSTTLHEPLVTTIAGYIAADTVTLTNASTRASTSAKICCRNQDGSDCIDHIACSTSADCTDTGFGWCRTGVYTAWGTNDTAAMQAAVDAAADAGGGDVAIPAGRYMSQQIYMPCAEIGTWASWGTCSRAYNNITLRGAGMDATVLEAWQIDATMQGSGGHIEVGFLANVPRDDSPNTPLSEVHGVTIRDLTVKSPKQARTRQYPMILAGHDVEIRNTRALGWSFECIISGGNGPLWFHHNAVESCNKPGKIVAGGGALNLNGSRTIADHNVIYADNWGGESASSITVFDSNEIICRSGGVTGFIVGSSNNGVYQVDFKNNTVRNCSEAFESGNGNGMLSNLTVTGNTFHKSGTVLIKGGTESNLLTYGYQAPTAHLVTTIAGNRWIDPPAAALQVGASGHQYGLEAIDFDDNTISYYRNRCLSGGSAGAFCLTSSDCGGAECAVAPAIVTAGYGGGDAFVPSTAYALASASPNGWNRYVVPTVDNGHYYRVTVAGTSASSEPTWPTDGSTVTSGSVTFTDAGPRPWLNVSNLSMSGGTTGIKGPSAGSVQISPGNGLLNNSAQIRFRNISADFDWAIVTGYAGPLNGKAIHDAIPAGFNFSDSAWYRGGAINSASFTCPRNDTYCDAVLRWLPFGTASLGFQQIALPSSPPALPTTVTVTRAGQMAPIWVTGTAYAFGAYVVKVSDNGHFYRAIVAGTSGGSEPTWPTSTGGTVVDGTVTWKESGTAALWQ